MMEMLEHHRLPEWFGSFIGKLSQSWNTRIVTETKQGCESSEIIHFKEDLEIADDLKMYAASENNLERFMRIVNVHI